MKVRRSATSTVATMLALAVAGVFGGAAAQAQTTGDDGSDIAGQSSPQVTQETEAGSLPEDEAADPASDPIVAPSPEPVAEQPAADTQPAPVESGDAEPASAKDADAVPADGSTAALRSMLGAGAAVDETSTPAPTYDQKWHNDRCDYWFFTEIAGAESGRDWSGWSGNPQLHFVFHELTDADGNVRIVYDRDIQDAWYHPRTVGEEDGNGNWREASNARADIDGVHWESAQAQQTVVLQGFKGGVDDDAKLAEAQAFFARAGVSYQGATYDRELFRGWGYTDAQIDEMEASNNADSMRRAAYEATQFAVWYFSSGHDVMGLFFQADAQGRVALTDQALRQFVPDVYDENNPDAFDSNRNWAESDQDRMATMKAAAWLIEEALQANTVAPQPGFVPTGYTKGADGSTRYGFAVSLVGGNGPVGVELRTADGSPLPQGVTLVDAKGKPVSEVAPGTVVYLRLPAGVDIASLPKLQMWGAAHGKQLGTPDFFVGDDNNTNWIWDPETGEGHEGPSALHYLIGLGSLDRPTVGRDWIAVDLLAQGPAEEPETEDPGTVDPADPTGSMGTKDASLVATNPRSPLIAPVAHAVEAVETGDPTNLAQTGSEAGALALFAFALIGAGGGVLVVRRRVARQR